MSIVITFKRHADNGVLTGRKVSVGVCLNTSRYGSMRLLGVLATRGEDAYARGDKVVVRTNRGLETGERFVWPQKMLLSK